MPSALVKQVARARKAARRQGLRADLSWSEWLQTVHDFDGKCAYCDEGWWTIDHFIPMVQGGPTSVDNCVPSCSKCNSRKGQQDPSWFVSHDVVERLRAYLERRGRGQQGWPLPEHAILREEGEQMKEIQWKAALQAEGNEIGVTSGNQHISIQLRQQGLMETDTSVRVNASLAPTEAIALAIELMRAASLSIEQMQASNVQIALSADEQSFSWPGKR